MQRRGLSFRGCAVESRDGFLGPITDILFEETTWNVRWFVINTEGWRAGPQTLLHPTALDRSHGLGQMLSVNLTKQQIAASPGIESDPPVSAQMTSNFYETHDFAPAWGAHEYGASTSGWSGESWSSGGRQPVRKQRAGSDPHLRSLVEVQGYYVHALDGDIGHLTDFLIDDESWKIDSALIDTKNWWVGKHVLLPAGSITEINWDGRFLRVSETCGKIRTSLPWTEA